MSSAAPHLDNLGCLRWHAPFPFPETLLKQRVLCCAQLWAKYSLARAQDKRTSSCRQLTIVGMPDKKRMWRHIIRTYIPRKPETFQSNFPLEDSWLQENKALCDCDRPKTKSRLTVKRPIKGYRPRRRTMQSNPILGATASIRAIRRSQLLLIGQICYGATDDLKIENTVEQRNNDTAKSQDPIL